MKKKEKTEEEKLEEMSSDFVGECKAQFPADGEWLEGHEKVFINGEMCIRDRNYIKVQKPSSILKTIPGN